MGSRTISTPPNLQDDLTISNWYNGLFPSMVALTDTETRISMDLLTYNTYQTSGSVPSSVHMAHSIICKFFAQPVGFLGDLAAV